MQKVKKWEGGTKIAWQSKSYYNTLILPPEHGKQVVNTLHHTRFTRCPRNKNSECQSILQLLYVSSSVTALESKQSSKQESKQSKGNSTKAPKQGIF